MEKNISLYIPYVFADISRETIANVFWKQEIGCVKSVDLVPKLDRNGHYYHIAFVHFYYWFDNIAAVNLLNKIRNSDQARVVYDDPYFWNVLENKTEKKAQWKRKICIDLSDMKPTNLLTEFDAVA